MSRTEVTAAETVGETLAALGVRQVFGVVGSGNFAVTASLVAHGASFVAARHEGGAVTMADAYARVTGTVGVCSVHQGPGLTNTMTGLTEAVKSRTPLLVLTADTAASALRSNFKIAQDQLVAAVGAVPEHLHAPASAAADTMRAYRRARLESRPVILMMPLDVQAGSGGSTTQVGEQPLIEPARPSSGAIELTAELLREAERPLIIAGRGAVLTGAGSLLEEIADRVGALLATSAVGNGLFARSPWSLGISGGFASPTAAELIHEADVVLAAGASLTMWTTRHGRLLNPTARIIQIDHETEAIGAHHRVDLAVIGDIREAAKDLLTALGDGPGQAGWRSDRLRERIASGRWCDVPYDDATDSTVIDPRTLSIALNRILPAERTVAIDSGHFMGYPAMYLDVPDAQAFVFTQAYQSIGLGLATAIGAAIARPDRLTVAALGDGGAMMGLADLETVARLNLRMLIVIYNDAAYGAEVHHFHPEGAALNLVRFPDVNFAALARAVGLEGVTVRAPEDLESVRAWCAGDMTPGLVIDAKVAPFVVAEWLEEAFRGH